MADDVGMNGETARRVIRNQDEAVHAWVVQLARDGAHIIETLEPWRRNAGWRTRPEALQALQAGMDWLFSNEPFPNLLASRELMDLASIQLALRDRPGKFKKGGVEAEIQQLLTFLTKLARCYSAGVEARSILSVPREHHPPRYAHIKDGLLARLVAEDLAAHIASGYTLDEILRTGHPYKRHVVDWRDQAVRMLEYSMPGEGVSLGLLEITHGVIDCLSLAVAKPYELGRAYLALGLIYLEEVQEKMPDYAEQSGQGASEPRVSMSFTGGNFYGGQFAAQIANIDSTIAGIVQQGGSEVADALKALERAVLSQAGLSDDQRQDLLDNVGYLAEAAQTPPERRNRGIIRSVLSALTMAAVGGEELNRAMEAWGHVLRGLLP